MKTQKRVLAALLCAAMLLLGGCAGQTDDTQSPVVFQEEETSSAVSRTESALEASATVQPASPEVSQLEESSVAESSASEEETSSVPETAAPEVAAAPTTTTPQAAPSTQTTACQHSMRDVGGVGNCSRPGQHIYECTKCGYTEYGDIIPPHHDGKYTCEYCGLPLKDGNSVRCLHVWIEENGELGVNGDTYSYSVVKGNLEYSIVAPLYYTGSDGELSIYIQSADHSIGSPFANIILYADQPTAYFRYVTQYGNGYVLAAPGSVSKSNFPQLGEFYFNDRAPADCTPQQLQQGFEEYLTQLLNVLQSDLLPRVEYTLEDLGFTSW